MFYGWECETNFGWQEVKVPSHSDPDVEYTVLFSPWKGEPACSCSGYRFRGQCSHQDEAVEYLCLWSSADDPDWVTKIGRQGEFADKLEHCPECGEKVRKVIYEEEDGVREESS